MRHQAVLSLDRIKDIEDQTELDDMLKIIQKSIDYLEHPKENEDLRVQLTERRRVRHAEPQIVEERRIKIEEEEEEEDMEDGEVRDDEVRRVRVVDEEDVRN